MVCHREELRVPAAFHARRFRQMPVRQAYPLAGRLRVFCDSRVLMET
jgi:hypothetical protein